MFRRTLLVVAGALFVMQPTRADACSPPRCLAPSMAPRDGSTVPANAPAFVFVPERDLSVPDPDPTSGLSIADGQGGVVQFEVTQAGTGEGYLLTPTSGWTPGATFTVSYPPAKCAGASPAFPTGATFTVSAARPLPTRIGTVERTTPTIAERRVFTASGSCDTPALVSSVVVEIAATTELDDFLSVAAIWSELDGASGVGRRYGDRAPGEPILLEYQTTCAADDPGADPGLGAGTHHVTVRAHVAGMPAELEPLSFDVELACPEPDASPGWSPDAGAPPAAAGGDHGGCSVTPRRREAPSFAATVLAVAAAAARRRARRDTSPPV